MKQPFYLMLLSFLLLFSGCEVIGGIFKAGVGVGIFIVVAILALVIFLVSKASKKQ